MGGPEVDFSSGLHNLVPDNIKVKKTVHLHPLPLELGASLIYHVETRGFRWKLNCKETVLGGKLTADVEARALEYRKRFSLPVIRVNCLVLGLRAALCPETNKLVTNCRVGFELRQGTAEITKLNTVRVKPQLFFKNIGLEAVTDISFQIPKQLFFELPAYDVTRGISLPSLGRAPRRSSELAPAPPALPAGSDAGSGSDVGDNDAWGVSLEMQEVNLIIKL